MVVTNSIPVQTVKLDLTRIAMQLKSKVPQDKVCAIVELSTDPRAANRNTAMELIGSVTKRGERGLNEIREIVYLVEEQPELGIAALIVLRKICDGRGKFEPYHTLDDWPLIEAQRAAFYAKSDVVARFAVDGIVERRMYCVHPRPTGEPLDNAERVLAAIASLVPHISTALAAFESMRFYADTAPSDLCGMRNSRHQEIREAAERKMVELGIAMSIVKPAVQTVQGQEWVL